MATATATANFQNDTDANFRAWATAISNKLSSLGLVKEVVTGEINLATVAKPANSAGFVSSGFQIWKFNDALQTNFPVFIRIDYGGQQISSPWWTHYGPALGITIGAAHTGAAITTQATAQKVVYMDNLAAALCHFSGSASRFAVEVGKSMFFSIERFKDGGGSDTGRGVIALAAGWYVQDGSNFYGLDSRWQMCMTPSGTNPIVETTWRCLLPSVDDGMTLTDATAFTVHPMTPRLEQAALGALVYFDGNLADLTTYDVLIAGKLRTYLAFDEFAFLAGERGALNRLAMRYE